MLTPPTIDQDPLPEEDNPPLWVRVLAFVLVFAIGTIAGCILLLLAIIHGII